MHIGFPLDFEGKTCKMDENHHFFLLVSKQNVKKIGNFYLRIPKNINVHQCIFAGLLWKSEGKWKLFASSLKLEFDTYLQSSFRSNWKTNMNGNRPKGPPAMRLNPPVIMVVNVYYCYENQGRGSFWRFGLICVCVWGGWIH